MARKPGSALKAWEYPKKSGIRIREILNTQAGETYGASYLVTVPSKITKRLRERKQFTIREAAERYAEDALAGSGLHGQAYFALPEKERNEFVGSLPRLQEHGLSINEAVDRATSLTASEWRAIGACIDDIRKRGISLAEAVRFAAKHLRPEGKTKTVADIVAELNTSKSQRCERGDLRERSYRDFKHRTERFAEGFAGRIASEISVDEIKAWLLGLGDRSPRTTKNDLAAIGELFKFATQSEYVSSSPIDRLTDAHRKELCGTADSKEPAILTPDEAERLLAAAHANPEIGLLAAVTLGLFCGLRTEEIKRLDWASVRLGESSPVVTIGPKIAKKRRIRYVEIPTNALEWLTLVPKREGQVAPNAHFNDFQKRFRKLQKLAGFGKTDPKGVWESTWQHNAMRHSYGSYHYAKHGNPLETARLLGHKASDQVLFDHYRALATKEQASAYFAITPPASSSNVLQLSA